MEALYFKLGNIFQLSRKFVLLRSCLYENEVSGLKLRTPVLTGLIVFRQLLKKYIVCIAMSIPMKNVINNFRFIFDDDINY